MDVRGADHVPLAGRRGIGLKSSFLLASCGLLLAGVFLPISAMVLWDKSSSRAKQSCGALMMCSVLVCVWSLYMLNFFQLHPDLRRVLLRAVPCSYTMANSFFALVSVVDAAHQPRPWALSILWSSSEASNVSALAVLPMLLSPHTLSMVLDVTPAQSGVHCAIVLVTLLVIIALIPSIASLALAPLFVLHACCVLEYPRSVAPLRPQTRLSLRSHRVADATSHRALSTEEIRAERQLVANMAHDLKTPLSSIVATIDIIAESVAECKAFFDLNALTPARMDHAKATADDCLHTIHITNSFMLMTINRCLDVAKSARGMKLQPKPDIVDLGEALLLPLHCMRSIQESIAIRMDLLDDEISQLVIADEQWIQENVLCLLSNAVKYSNSGEVAVRVLLEEAPPVGDADIPLDICSRSRSRSRDTQMTPATPRGGSPGLVQFLRFEVEDTGIGMTEENMRELFSAFKQNQRLAGGTGLGLFSFAKRVEAHHGRCGVQGRRDGGQGSLFWFTVPYRSGETGDDRHRKLFRRHSSVPSALLRGSSAKRCAGTSPKRGLQKLALGPGSDVTGEASRSTAVLSFVANACTPRDDYVAPVIPIAATQSSEQGVGPRSTVLLVDDSPLALKVTAKVMHGHGYEVTTARNGAMALEVIERQLREQQRSGAPTDQPAFGAILLDLQMPIMDGLEAARRLRVLEAASRGLRHTVIGLSANCEDDVVLATAQAGFDAYLPKPFTMLAFSEIMSALQESES